jgi:hypothetical protein
MLSEVWSRSDDIKPHNDVEEKLVQAKLLDYGDCGQVRTSSMDIWAEKQMALNRPLICYRPKLCDARLANHQQHTSQQ